MNWQGRQICNCDEFIEYLYGFVRSRVIDESNQQSFENDLRALCTTDMASKTLAQLLSTDESDREPWEIGEALAECILEEEFNVVWPWNEERDKKTKKASLPGADLVGLIENGGDAKLIFGEVKTSNHASTPPTVMTGRSGMIYQLESISENFETRRCLVNWLYTRCKNNNVMWPLFEKAITNYLQSGGKDLLLFGFLIRDTVPHENDLKNRAKDLSKKIHSSMKVELFAWYCPVSIENWPSILVRNQA